METYYIYQFSSVNGEKEYVIISEDADLDNEDNTIYGFEFDRRIELSTKDFNFSSLPLDTVLMKQ